MFAAGIRPRSAAPVPAKPAPPENAQGRANGPDTALAQWYPSPSFGPRRGDGKISVIVIHYTAMDSAEAALERLCDPAVEVSAHYLIGSDGRIWQMVRDQERAWHAGLGEWAGEGDVNSRSIGIELDNRGDHPFSAAQMDRLEALLRDLMARHDLGPSAVIGHSDMAPERKCDPGRRFDWARLARQGLALWPAPISPPEAAAIDPELFAANLRAFGYPKAPPEILLDAMRQRFRPWASGPLTPKDMALARALAQLAVDPDAQSA
ncbi:MAG: N-acetylmuramoyl-L-alanine amidase [Mangrovicoccus sp.]|nr:N-acetylmuramoyl-L-alanine amidase [Mangrovicoccus sp.]